MIPTSRYLGGPFLARRRNRRWLVGLYWGLMVPLTMFVVGRAFSRPQLEWFFYPMVVLMVVNLLNLGRFGLKPVGSMPRRPDLNILRFGRGAAERKEIEADWNYDEREIRERDRVYFRAYRWALGLSFGLFTALALSEAVWPEWSRWLGPVFLCLLIAVIAGLPQTLVLWNQPDVEEAGTRDQVGAEEQ
jgi:hypothetical protein